MAHVILVSAQVLLNFTLGLWDFGLWDFGLGLDNFDSPKVSILDLSGFLDQGYILLEPEKPSEIPTEPFDL